MKKTIIFATIILTILVGGGLYMVHAQYSSTIAQLKQQTIPGQLEAIRAEHKTLEQLKKEFESKGGADKISELERKSMQLQQLLATGSKLSK